MFKKKKFLSLIIQRSDEASNRSYKNVLKTIPLVKSPLSLNQLMGFVAEERKHHKVYPPPEQVFTWTQMCDIRDVSEAGVWLGSSPSVSDTEVTARAV